MVMVIPMMAMMLVPGRIRRAVGHGRPRLRDRGHGWRLHRRGGVAELPPSVWLFSMRDEEEEYNSNMLLAPVPIIE